MVPDPAANKSNITEAKYSSEEITSLIDSNKYVTHSYETCLCNTHDLVCSRFVVLLSFYERIMCIMRFVWYFRAVGRSIVLVGVCRVLNT